MDNRGSIIKFENIDKFFPGVKALSRVSFEVKTGYVHAITGGNGAGKSTLINIATGALTPSNGRLYFEGEEVEFSSPNDARKRGIIVVPQVVRLCDTLSISENIFLGNTLKSRGIVDWKKMDQETKRLLDLVGIDISPVTKVENLPLAKKQLINILRAINANPKLLILDEPTAVLTDGEIKVLYGLIEDLKRKGVTIIYISHRMEEIFDLADDISVLRDGQHVGTFPKSEISREDLIKLMVGHNIEETVAAHREYENAEVVIKADNIATKSISDISFEVRKGEILGIAGLVGSGRTELIRACMGIDPLLSGSLEVKGLKRNYSHIGQAIRDGIALVPEDRVHQGLVPGMNVAENMSLTSLEKFVKGGLINFSKEKKTAREYVEKLKIKTHSVTNKVSNLSGGNQQKVVLARWLIKDSDIFFMDEPTQGIDIGAKSEIYQLISHMAEEGKTVIVVSSDSNELLGICNRVLVMREGTLSGELQGDQLTRENIMKLAMADIKDKREYGREKKVFAAISMAIVFIICFLTVGHFTAKSKAETYAEIPSIITLRDTEILKGKRLGVSLLYKGDEWCTAVSDAFEAIGKEYGAEIMALDGNANVELQSRQVENLLSIDCDMILIDPTSPSGLSYTMNRVIDSGTPLIVYDQAWAEGVGRCVSTVSWEQYDTGRLIGEYLVDYIKTELGGKASIVELTVLSVEHNQYRYQGLHDVLDKATDIEITYIGTHDYQSVRENAEKIISSIAVPFDIVVAESDNGAQGAIASLRHSNKNNAKVFSMGTYGKESFEAIHADDSDFVAGLNVDAWVFVNTIIDAAIDYFEGKELDDIINIPLYVVDKNNIEEFWTFE